MLNVNTNGSWFPVVLSAKSKSISAKEKFISSNERLSYQSFVEKVLIGFIENEKNAGLKQSTILTCVGCQNKLLQGHVVSSHTTEKSILLRLKTDISPTFD